MGNIYKTKAKGLKGDPYIGVCFQALETLERLCLIQTRVNYWQTKAWILTSFWPNRARGKNRNKRNRYKLLILVSIEWSMHKERILRRAIDLSFAQGSFQVNLYKMIRFLSEIQGKYTKLAKIVKISFLK